MPAIGWGEGWGGICLCLPSRRRLVKISPGLIIRKKFYATQLLNTIFFLIPDDLWLLQVTTGLYDLPMLCMLVLPHLLPIPSSWSPIELDFLYNSLFLSHMLLCLQ